LLGELHGATLRRRVAPQCAGEHKLSLGQQLGGDLRPFANHDGSFGVGPRGRGLVHRQRNPSQAHVRVRRVGVVFSQPSLEDPHGSLEVAPRRLVFALRPQRVAEVVQTSGHRRVIGTERRLQRVQRPLVLALGLLVSSSSLEHVAQAHASDCGLGVVGAPGCLGDRQRPLEVDTGPLVLSPGTKHVGEVVE